MGKVNATRCDAKGRIYLREKIRKQYGNQFIVLEDPDGLKLLAVPQDPVADLEELGEHATIAELKDDIHEQAEAEGG